MLLSVKLQFKKWQKTYIFELKINTTIVSLLRIVHIVTLYICILFCKCFNNLSNVFFKLYPWNKSWYSTRKKEIVENVNNSLSMLQICNICLKIINILQILLIKKNYCNKHIEKIKLCSKSTLITPLDLFLLHRILGTPAVML